MSELLQQIVSGLAAGGVYGSLALALVLIHRATGVVNFAQGEMATFTTYIAWTLTTNHGIPYWPAVLITLAIAFGGGVGLHQVVIRPLEGGGSVLPVVVVTIGLLLALNGLTAWIWSGEQRSMKSPFGSGTLSAGGVAIAWQDVGTIAVSLVVVGLLWALFQLTKVGLALRAAATNPDEARLVGVRVPWMLSLGWGLAAMLGTVSGLLIAYPAIDPNLMQPVLIYAFAAAVLGGIDSPIGAVVGGLLVGVGLNLLSAYVDVVGTDLRLPAALALILGVLLLRPAGLFGTRRVHKV